MKLTEINKTRNCLRFKFSRDVSSCRLVVSQTFRRISKQTSSVSSPGILVSPYFNWSIISDVSKDRFAFTDLPDPVICTLRFFQNAGISLPVNMMINPGNVAMRNSKLAIILPCNPLPIYLQQRTLDKLRNYQLMKKNYTTSS